MHFQNSIFTGLALAATANAHMKMGKPVPYAAATLNNSPLDASGSDYPCKQLYDDTTPATDMALGSTQPLSFIGGATHGGGSCQIVISYDMKPTKQSTFKVIHSIEGGCPVKGQTGNIGGDAAAPDPDTYSFTVPTNIPTGKAVVGWIWYNKVGNREAYMNCGPINLTGGKSKRDDELMARNQTLLKERASGYDSLPNIFLANIGNGCATQDSTDVLFPNPGDSVEKLGLQTSAALATPVGTGCGAAVAPAATGSGSSGSGSDSGSGSSPSPSAAAPATTQAPAVSPGVFATVAPSGAAPSPSPAAASPSPDSVANPAPVVPASSAGATPETPAASPAPNAPASSGSSAGVMTGACSPEGQWNCIGGTQFQRCASGTWSVAMAVAAGTSCTSGSSANMAFVAAGSKRNVQITHRHLRQHLRHFS